MAASISSVVAQPCRRKRIHSVIPMTMLMVITKARSPRDGEGLECPRPAQGRHRIGHPRPQPYGAGRVLAQGSAGGVVDQALACLLGLLGLRSSEALHIDIEHLGIRRGHRTVTVLGKGSTLAVIPLPPRVARAVDLAAGERTSGPLLGRNGERLNRQAATRIVVRLAKQAGVKSTSLRAP